jgi:4a-hydroxytetrahydrobiopterin dehydratase
VYSGYVNNAIANKAKNTMNLPSNKGINKVINRQCRIYSSQEPPLEESAIKLLVKQTPAWHFASEDNLLVRTFNFQNYYQTIDFVNHLADICHEQDHHPELNVSYRRCEVAFNTHTVNGVTENDFICAAKIDAINLADLDKKQVKRE